MNVTKYTAVENDFMENIKIKLSSLKNVLIAPCSD